VGGILIYVKEALLTYATTLAFYLYLRASEYYSQHPELLHSHPVFARLLQLKQALITLEELDFHLSESDSEIDDTEEDDSSISEEGSTLLKRYRKGSQLTFDDLAELSREAEEAAASVKATKMSKPSTLPRPPKEPPKKKRKISTAEQSATVFDLEEPTYVPSKPRASTLTPISGEDDAFGDAVVLGSADATDKKARRHTLRFHTSKIESASARRQGARLALGGDDDVPYRERRKEKEARAQREAQAGKRGQGGDDLNDIEPESLVSTADKADVGWDDESAEESADGYYSLVQRQKREQKATKKLAYEAAKATIRCVVQPCLADRPAIAFLLPEHAHTGRLMKVMRKARARSRVQS
jgi:U3 small nucleolar RNA-associated protein 3